MILPHCHYLVCSFNISQVFVDHPSYHRPRTPYGDTRGAIGDNQGYAWEMTTMERGWGLDGLLRSRTIVINGITNGVDLDEWNPTTDRHIASQFCLQDLDGKAVCKAALQKELDLDVRPEVPLIGFIGRLDYQKGPDILEAALPELMQADVQMKEVFIWLFGSLTISTVVVLITFCTLVAPLD